MDFFIDTADSNEVAKALAMGLVDGVTTNPSLVAKTGLKVGQVIAKIAAICSGPISCEVLSTDTEGMLAEAAKIREFGPNMVIKLPLTTDGLAATRACALQGIHTNVTLCFSSNQALLAAKAGATYISPFIGRLDDIGHDGMGLIREIKTIYDNYQFPTKILVASVRSPLHVRNAALAGAHVATIPFDVLAKLVHHPLTASGLEKFLHDANHSG